MPLFTILSATTPLQPEETNNILEVWENSVRATHLFLSEQDIIELRALVKEAIQQVALFIAVDETQKIVGFAGISGNMLEMLFIDAARRKNGIGKKLLQHVLSKGVNKVDVNEQNPQAIGFYQHIGFKITGRSELDGQGRPFPILHMSL